MIQIKTESFVFLVPYTNNFKNELLYSKNEEIYDHTLIGTTSDINPCDIYGTRSRFAFNTNKLLNQESLHEFYDNCAEHNIQKLKADYVYLVSKENFSDLCEKEWVDLTKHLPIIKTATFTFVRN